MKHKAKKQKVTKTKGFKIAMSTMAGVLAVGAACGITIALTSSIKTEYINLNPYSGTTKKFDYDFPACTKWVAPDPSSTEEKPVILPEPAEATDVMKSLMHQSDDTFANRFNFSEVISTSPDVSILDKSFVQSSYYAQTYWTNASPSGVKTPTGWTLEKPQLNETDFPQTNLVLSKDGQPHPDIFASLSVAPAGTSSNDIVNTYKACGTHGLKNLILPGFEHITPLGLFKKDSPDIFNKMAYILVDGEIDDEHISSIQIKADQSAFLAGIAACQYLEERWEDVYSKVNNGQLAVGTFGGMNVPTVTCFMGGLERGIWAYNTYMLPAYCKANNITDKQEIEKRTVKLIGLGKSYSYFTGTFVIGDGKLITQELLAKGADIIMAVAGAQTGDVVAEIQSQKSPCRVIGVDSAMENGDWGTYLSKSNLLEPNTKIILMSAEKNIAQLTAQILNNIWTGNRAVYPNGIEGGNITFTTLDDGKKLDDLTVADQRDGVVGSIGYTTIGNLYNNGAKLSNAGQEYLIRAIEIMGEGWECSTYEDAVEHIIKNTVYVNTGSQEEPKTLLQILSENNYFNY